MSGKNCSRLARIAHRAVSIRLYSSSPLPENISELCSSQTKEVAMSQAVRVFGSGFLSHQDAISEMQVVEQVDPIDMMEQVTRGADNRVEFYHQNSVTMDMKTNVPEPFQAEEDSEDKLKEGLPAGLSDSQVNLEGRSNMDFRLEIRENIV
eukprot:GFUD01139004.1.p1 GENE.GFUD01139004.1~~GFUD01139004.1.p1  ORF type:complete len:165 (-),score=59.37 GFUD01139004.1:130-582(-)